MDKKTAYFIFGNQFLGILAILLALLFFAGFSGGVDLIGYDLPGFDEIFTILPFAFPFTIIVYVIYPKLKNQTIASLLLISALILNLI